MLLNDLLSCFECNIKISQILQQNAITAQWKEMFTRFHVTIMKMVISILYHVVVNSQLNRDTLRPGLHCQIFCDESCALASQNYKF